MILYPVNLRWAVLRNGRIVSGTIANLVSAKDPATAALAPKQARVDALEDSTGRLVASTWSDPQTGAYTLVGLDETIAHTVLARDPLRNFRPVAADRILPRPANRGD